MKLQWPLNTDVLAVLLSGTTPPTPTSKNCPSSGQLVVGIGISGSRSGFEERN